MKKAEIIKNGNVNLKTVKLDKKGNKEIDWELIRREFVWGFYDYISLCGLDPTPDAIVDWFKKRLS